MENVIKSWVGSGEGRLFKLLQKEGVSHGSDIILDINNVEISSVMDFYDVFIGGKEGEGRQILFNDANKIVVRKILKEGDGKLLEPGDIHFNGFKSDKAGMADLKNVRFQLNGALVLSSTAETEIVFID